MGPPFTVVASGATDVGRRREQNEDAILLRPELGLYVVADGAGGHNAGKVASALAVRSIANYFGATDLAARASPSVDRFGLRSGARRLARAIQKANHDIVEISSTSEQHQGMGSTVVAIALDATEPLIHVAHVGDSRCYRLRDGYLELLTHDHSLLNDVMEINPDLPDNALGRLPRKVVTRALGMEAEVRISVRSFQVADDDTYLLCSDGLSGEVADGGILDALADARDPQAAATHLLAMANHAGGSDNIAAIVLRCAIAGAEKSRALTPMTPLADDEGDDESAASLLRGLEVVTGLDASGRLRTVRLGGDDKGLFKAVAALVKQDPRAHPLLQGRKCPACGAPNLDTDRFCPECGAHP